MKLSIVATLYQSAPYITEFYTRISTTAQTLVASDYEIIFVNDGSPDNSLDLVIALTEQDPRVLVVDLSRNFGHHKAMMTGLTYAKGERIFLIDTDLEEEPEWLLSFAEQMIKENVDVVYGVQERRKGKWMERWTGALFYKSFNLLTGLSLPENLVTARLMSQRYVKALLSHQEREIFIPGLWHITGFEQYPHSIQKKNSSETTYTFRKKLSLLVNAVTGFSNAPLIYIFYIGIAISGMTMLYITYLVAQWFLIAKPVSGWTSLIVSIWFFGGLIVSCLGIVGIYISKIFIETKQRPYTIVRNIYKK
ncbi:MAG: glycosyltransferase family 2 protein [Tenuifilaceae bacterium]|nr:glycosyltransferase family 2 protein [Tenuifilaceae bacterium]